MEEGPCQFYRITILEAKSEPKFMPTGAVSFKVGWAWAALEVASDDSKENEQANFHPGKWDNISWSISGSGNVCQDGSNNGDGYHEKYRAQATERERACTQASRLHQEALTDINYSRGEVNVYDIISVIRFFRVPSSSPFCARCGAFGGIGSGLFGQPLLLECRQDIILSGE